MRRTLAFALAWLVWAPASASGTWLTDGGAVAGLDSWAFSGNSPESNRLSFDGSVVDHVFEIFGYLGNATGVVPVTPTNFDELVPIAVSGNTASSRIVLNAGGAALLGLAPGDITLDYDFTLVDATHTLIWDVSLGNASLAALDLAFYAYFDLDLEGTFPDDLAVGSVSGFQVTDGGTGFTLVTGSSTPADHFQLAAFSNVKSALDAMGPTGAADLPDASASFGPGDFTGALQFDVSIAPGGSQPLALLLVPEPATLIQFSLGLFGLAFAGRKRA